MSKRMSSVRIWLVLSAPILLLVSAGVIISLRRNNYPRRAPGNRSKKFSRRSLTVPKIVAQSRKRVIPSIYTLKRTLLPILIHALPLLIHWLGFRLSAPYLNSLLTHLGSQENPRTLGARQPIRIDYYVTRVVNQSESSTEKNPSNSSANQNRVLRHPSRQPRAPELSLRHPRALGAWRSLLGSRLDSARYSLS